MNRQQVKRMIVIVTGIVAFMGLFLACAFFLQDRMIYYPRPYPADLPGIPRDIIPIHYETSAGRQTQYFLPPATVKSPRRIWILFGGNAALALGWIDFILTHRNPADGFLFFDYPGYGNCEGHPSPGAILKSTNKAVDLLLQRYTPVKDRGGSFPPLALLGHSLGAAAALNFAASYSASWYSIDRIILVSPFTSLRDMGRIAVGSPLHLLLRHNFDNRKRLREILNSGRAISITIYHGDRDEIVPVTMGRELAEEGGNRVRYVEIRGAMHNDIIELAQTLLHRDLQ